MFWIIRVKVELLMKVTVHIYCLFYFCSLASFRTGWNSWSLQMTRIDFCFFLFSFCFLIFFFIYLLRIVTCSISSLYIFVFFFLSFFSTSRKPLGLGHKCCKYNKDVGMPCGFRSAGHPAKLQSKNSLETQPKLLKHKKYICTFWVGNTHKHTNKISARPHMYLHFHIDGTQNRRHAHELNMFSISFFEGSMYFLISLSAIRIIVWYSL